MHTEAISVKCIVTLLIHTDKPIAKGEKSEKQKLHPLKFGRHKRE